MGNFLTGTGAPDNALGNNGDVYLATDTLAFYGPKAAGAWPAALPLAGTTATQTLTNKTISGASNTVSNLAASTIASGTLAHERGGLEADVSAYSGLVKITGGATSAVTAPSGAIVGDTDSQTLTNKTLTAPVISTISNTGVLTLPTSTDTLVGKDTTDTLTNKTISGASNTVNNLNASNLSSGTVAAARGGVGADASGYTGALVFASGTPSAVAPSTSGNVLTSNGTTWTSATPAGGGSSTGAVTETGVISPAQLTASQNDYNPTGLSTCSIMRLSTSSSWALTGLVAQAAGTRIKIFNVGASGLSLTGESGSSSAANRFTTTIIITAGEGAEVWYDGTSSRWRKCSL